MLECLTNTEAQQSRMNVEVDSRDFPSIHESILLVLIERCPSFFHFEVRSVGRGIYVVRMRKNTKES